MTDQTNFRLLTQYAETQSRLLPLKHWKQLSESGDKLGKNPAEKGWKDRSYPTEEMVEHMKAGNNVGFRVGGAWLVIDYDPRNDLDAEGRPKAQNAQSVFKLLADHEIHEGSYAWVRTGGGGMHIYLRIPHHRMGWRGRETIEAYGKGVEIKHSEGKYVVAAGSVWPGPKEGPFEPRAYLWGAGSVPLSGTCEAPESLFETYSYKSPPASKDGSGDESFGRFSAEQLWEVLQNFPVEDFSNNEDWLNLAMASHWFSGGEGREEFVLWSTGDPKYANLGDQMRNRWDSFSPVADGVKSGLIFKLLEKYQVDASLWPRERTSQVFVAPDAEELDIIEGEDTYETRVLREMNRKHCMALVGDKVLVGVQDMDKIDRTVHWRFVQMADVARLYLNKRILVPTGTPDAPRKIEKTHLQFWSEHGDRRTYEGGVEFLPNQEKEVWTPNGLVLNEWTGWPYSLEDGRGSGDWGLMQELIFKAISRSDKAIYEYILNWMAYSVQNPVGPQGLALVLRGPKGCGKSTLAHCWQKMFGRHGIETDEADDVFGKFNMRMATTLGLVLNEAIWAGDRALVGKVKSRITENSIRVEKKFVDSTKVKNNLKIMMTTNEDWAVPAEKGARRFMVLDCDLVWSVGHKFYGDLIDQMGIRLTDPHGGGIRAMFYDLMKRDIGDFHPQRDMIRTKALGEQAMHVDGDIAQWWVDVVSDGEMQYSFDPDPDFRQNGPLSDWDTRPVAVPLQALRESFMTFCGGRPQGDLAYNFRQRFPGAVKDVTKGEVRRKILPDSSHFIGMKSNKRGSADCMLFPPLPEIRRELTKVYGVEFEPLEEEMAAGGVSIDDLV